MASTYALPASAMNHGHGHSHIHSHSVSPSRPNSKSMRQDQSNGSLHTYSLSESQLDYHEHSHSRQRSLEHSEFVDQKEPTRAQPAYIEEEEVEEDPFGMSYDLPAYPSSYRPPLNTANVLPQTHHHDHTHRNPSVDPRSRFTGFLLPYVLRWPLLHTILSEKDSRRIFYFVSVNFAFMLVQACYGYLTDSLGLLSDSVHMFFDCLALGVGLFAAIASRWPPSERFPYGFGKLESLSGFGNAVFLMLISLEILMEAAERLFDGRETHRLAELFVVSTLGLLVNFIGLFCFGHHGHAHHGHDHGNHNHGPKAAHKHSHSHDHAHGHDHDRDHHSHDHGHDHANHTPLLMDEPKTTGHSHDGHVHTHSHSHSHDNDNMMGIYLHVLADALGSAAVIVSTIMIYFTGWNGWDPLASCIIAIAIFASAVPLLGQCAKKLLLTIPDEIEYNLREALGGVGDLRGVASHSVPRFWLGDKNTEDENEQVLGVIHISSTRGSDTDDVRARTSKFLSDRGIDVVVQVEKDGDSSCWCGGNLGKSPGRFS